MGAESIALLVLFLPHAIGGAFLAWWILPATARHELRGWFRDDDGGTPVAPPPTPRNDGDGAQPPLPDAVPSVVRLREPMRLGDGLPAPSRRPAHPVEPERRREPQRR